MQGTIFEGWYAAEIAKLYEQEPTDRPGVLMCVPCWGDKYVKRLVRHCLASLMAPANLAALRKWGHLIVLYTDDRVHLWRCLGVFENAGLRFAIREIPKEVLEATDRLNKYQLLGVVQGVGLQWAARTGRGFHMTQPDHCYSARYMEAMARLSKNHEALAQTSVSANIETAEADLEAFRQPGGALEVSDRELGDLGWRHLHPQSRVAFANEEGFAHHNAVMWKAADAIHIVNPLLNAAWLSPKLCREAPVIVPATTDGEGPALMPNGCWHIPGPDQGMTFVELSDSSKPAPDKTDFVGWSLTTWTQMNMSDAYLPFMQKRVLVPTKPDAEHDVPLELIEKMHADILNGLVGLKKSSMERYFSNLLIRRLRRYGSIRRA